MSRAKLLKIDTEGYELNVIKGLGDSIEVVNNLIVEMWDPSAKSIRSWSNSYASGALNCVRWMGPLGLPAMTCAR